MTTQSVEYRSCVRLNCGTELPASVILCIPPELVALKDCPVSGEQPFEYSTIDAVLDREVCTKGYGCTTTYWTYWFTYDDAQLVDGGILTSEGITGIICDNCFTQWVDEKVGNEPYIRDDGSAQVFVSPHGCEYVINSESTGISVADTPSIDLTLSGGGVLSGEVNLSVVDGNNTIVEKADGLYVCPLSVTDSSTVNLTLTEGSSECQDLKADVLISATVGNQIVVSGGGLFVSPAAVQAGMENLSTDIVAVANIGTGEDTLQSYNVPGGTLAVDGDRLEIRAHGSFTANANAKRLRAYFGATLLLDFNSPLTNAYDWDIKITIVRKAAAGESVWVVGMVSKTGILDGAPSTYLSEGGAAENLAIANLFKFTGEGVANGDIFQGLLIVDKYLA